MLIDELYVPENDPEHVRLLNLVIAGQIPLKTLQEYEREQRGHFGDDDEEAPEWEPLNENDEWADALDDESEDPFGPYDPPVE